MPSSIAQKARRAALLYMAGQDPSSVWVPPTGNYTIKLYDIGGDELTGGGYAAKTVAVTGCWEESGGTGEAFKVWNANNINFDAATDDWVPVATEKWFRVGETEPDFVFELDALVSVASGLAYGIDLHSRVLDDAN